jgi:protein-tyrosine phosphatase
MIDLHCHVLPGVDDGPATAEASIALVRGAQEDGITTIAATPHVDWSHPGLDSRHIRAAVRALHARLDAAGVDVRIVPGAEVAANRAQLRTLPGEGSSSSRALASTWPKRTGSAGVLASWHSLSS